MPLWLALLFCLGTPSCRRPNVPRPSRILLIQPAPSKVRTPAGLAVRGAMELLRMRLEAAGYCPIRLAPGQVPGVDLLSKLRPEDQILECRFELASGAHFEGSLRMVRLKALRESGAASWGETRIPPTDLQGILDHVLARLGPPRPTSEPRKADITRLQVETLGLLLENLDLDRALTLAQQAVRLAPDSALSQFLAGEALYRLHLQRAVIPQVQLGQTEAHFREGLRLHPGHPDLTTSLAQMKTDAGDHRGALEVLEPALKAHPNSPLLLAGLAYAARVGGLLDLAHRAQRARSTVVPESIEPSMAENTLLYLGDRSAFKETLREVEGHRRNGVVRFYRGYLDLAEGRAIEARAHFLAAEAQAGHVLQFDRLARIFRLGLEGDRGAALRELRLLDRDRVGLRVPDGEFTFKMAEAYAWIGEPESATDLAQRAFAQGFCCAEWFEGSPFLEPIRRSPRWQSLIGRVRERRDLLAKRFPPSRFPV